MFQTDWQGSWVMVNSRFCTCLYIVMIVVVFVLAQPVNSKKHRVLHSLAHQHRHQTHHHRKPHAKIHHNHRHNHLALMKKFSRSITTNNSNVFINVTKFPSSGDSLPSESTNQPMFSLGSNLANEPKIQSAFSDTWTKPASSQFDNFSNNDSTTTNSRNSTPYPFSSILSSTSRSIVDAGETIASLVPFGINGIIDDPSEKSTSHRSLALTNTTGESVANRTLDGTELKQERMVPKGATEGIANKDNLKSVTDQSISSTQDNATTYNREKFVKKLEELFGPTEGPKDLGNVDTPLVVLVRKKRSNEEKAERHEPRTRTLLDFDGPDTADETENLQDSSNVYHKRVKRNDPMDFDENPYALNPNYLQDLEDSFAPSALEIQAQKSDDDMLRKLKLSKDNPQVSDDKLRLKRDTNYANYEGNGEIDPAIGITQNIKNSEQQMMHKDVWTSSSIPSPEKFSENDQLSTKKDTTLIDSTRVTVFSSDPLTSGGGKNEEGRKSREDFSREEKSAAEPENLQDDNSVSRYGLNDVYPDSIEDSPAESMVPLVRTKRFGEGFVYPESPDVSYANEQPDSGRVVPDEPFAEDNEIIDSMLNKVEDKSPEETGEAEYKKVGSEVDEKAQVSLRDKRDTENSSRAKRRFGYGGNRRHRKNRRGKKKKKNRHRLDGWKKRGALLSDREYRKQVGQSERDSSKDDEDRFHEIYDQDVMSPHDGRRRRDYEDETNDNLHYNINESALGQVERQLRESEAPRANGDGSIDDNASREKRGTRRDDLATNDASQNADKNLTGPKHAERIKDIQELVQKLLVKVNELAVNDNDVKPEPSSTKNPQYSKTVAKAIAQSSEAPKPIQEATFADKPTGNPVNSMRRRKSCWIPSRSDRHAAKIDRASKSIGEGCEGRIRRKRKPGRKWDRWTDWSSCSVTCGKGRQIRWRHCLRNCSTAETEMEEKACQFPACAPGKFLGIFG